MEVSVHLHASATMPPRNSPHLHRYPLNMRLATPQSQSGRFGKKKNSLALPGLDPRFLGCTGCGLVTDYAILAATSEKYGPRHGRKDGFYI
jgi:hypothetical protein